MQNRDTPSLAVARDAGEAWPIPASTDVDPWRLVRTDHDHARSAHYESLFALANGSLGVRGGLEEAPSPTQGSFLTAVWERTPIEYHERFPGFARTTDTRLPVADGTRIALNLDGQAADLAAGEWLDFEQSLDLRRGCLRRRLRWRSPAGATLQIDAERIVPLHAPGLLCIRYRVQSIDYRGALALDSALVADLAAATQGDDPRFGARVEGGLRLTAATADDAGAGLCQATQHSGIRLACGQRHRLDGRLGFTEAGTDTGGARQRYTAMLAPGESVTLEKYVAYAWSEPGDDTADASLQDTVAAALDQALDESFDGHLALQAAAWADFWRTVDLAIDGDAATEQALRLNLFHLRQSASRDGHGSAAAKSLTGEGYEGHYFWDAEAFVLPALACLAPELARGMLDYRVRTLDRARAHAREMNHARGALYAWRTISGDECSAYFPSGSAQYHINAAIAFAVQLYVDATGDHDFLLRGGGAEMLFETARLWLQVGSYNPRRNHAFCICQVTGPDEYTALVDNNHYTNRMAQKHLRHAAAVADWMMRGHPGDYARLAARIALDADEIDAWRKAADAMYLPVDARLGIFPQDDTFLDKPPLPDTLREDAQHRPLLLRLHPLTIYRYQVCKQADVLQAFVLAGEDLDRDSKRRNFDYYEGVTVHDSTLSASTFGIVAAEVGHAEKAWRYFLDALRVDLENLHGNTAHGVHLAAMAGSWLGLAWGFGGLRCAGEMPAFAPRLPAAWRGYRFGLRWRGRRLRVAVGADTATYTLVEGDALDIRHHGRTLTLRAGQPAVLPLSGGGAAFPRPLKAVIFDLDGVIADTAVVHLAAWKKLADELGLPFDDAVGERLKGVDRRASLEIVLEHAPRPYSEAEKEALAARKNDYYRQQIERFGPGNLLPGARDAVESVRRAGLKTALASSSRNAPLLLDRLGIAGLFDYVVDAGRIRHPKPDPEIFLAAAAGLGLAPRDCLGVEDAAAGITSIHAAGMAAVGIGRSPALADADALLPDVAAFDIGRFTTQSGETDVD